MNPLNLLPCCLLLILSANQLPAQVDISVYPSKTVFDSLRYEKVDENSKPANLSCRDGGYGLYQFKISETDFTEMDIKWDTIKTDKEEWTNEDMNDFDKKYNEEHQQELKELQNQDIEGYREIQKVCEEKILDLIQNKWTTDDYCLCLPNCKSMMEGCYITKGEVIAMRNTKAEYRYETLSATKLTDEGPPNEFELLLRIIKIYEATVYFKVKCFCWDNNEMVNTAPSDENGESASAFPTGSVLAHTNNSSSARSQNALRAMQTNITATGTGNTTGHIADIKIKNNENTPINILPQTVYIPSDGQYQPYVADIPGTTVPPKGTVTIPVTGYCADVHKPPVGTGDGMPPIDTWITTTPAPTPNSGGTDYPIVTNVVPPFTGDDIPKIVTSPGFTPNPPPRTTPIPTNIITTWPGTDIPINGTINPIAYPETFAPVIIDALKNISIAFDKLKGEGTVNTPFGGDPVKERESVIQQTFWIFTADVTGDRYQKEHFQEKVIEQFENSSGKAIATLPEPEKKKLDGGVDAFWNVFTAVGVEAKVLSTGVKDETQSSFPPGVIESNPDMIAEMDDDKCKCKGGISVIPSYPKDAKTKLESIKFDEEKYGTVKNTLAAGNPDLEVEDGDGLEFQIVPTMECTNCVTKKADCKKQEEKVEIKAVGFTDAKGKAVYSEYTAVKPDLNGKYSVSGTIKSLDKKAKPPEYADETPVLIKIKISWKCKANFCRDENCSYEYTIEVKRKISKEERKEIEKRNVERKKAADEKAAAEKKPKKDK